MFRFILAIVLMVLALVALSFRSYHSSRATRMIRAEANPRAIEQAETNRRITGIVLVVLIVMMAFAGVASVIRVVPANNVGIPVTLGHIGKPMNSGVQFTAPWTKINNLSTRVQELSMLAAEDEGDKGKDDSIEIIAAGGGAMNVDLTVRYYVKAEKADDLFRQAGSMDLIKERFVRPDAREVTRNVFSLYTAEEGYSTERALISQTILEELGPRLAERGIILDSVNVRDVRPEQQVLQSINNILKARNEAAQALEQQKKDVTDAETRRQVAEKDKQATITKAEGDAEAVRIAAEAQSEANNKIAASLTQELTELKIAEACADAIANTNAAVVNVCSGETQGGGTSGVSDTTSVIVDSRG